MRSPWIEIAVNAINDKKGQNTLIIDVGDVLGISDNFVITSGGNTRQVRALVEEIEAQITNKFGPKPIRIEGNNDYLWVLM
ncbi:MAG: RsfS/YbeB/iojap family protein, partial [Actinomycetota bacterium]|nr:RsfS/YbeB/iojap family protein [Actinomycetota bacterium]